MSFEWPDRLQSRAFIRAALFSARWGGELSLCIASGGAGIFAGGARSYRDLPRILYQIQWKFRDEVRPRFGVMRGREFLMKDAYSFDLDEAAGRRSYNRMFVAYLRTFGRMGL